MRYLFSWLISFAALALLTPPTHGQTIRGTITDARTGAGVPFVNIGLVRKAVGTVANEQGVYVLPSRAALPTDTVRISSLGFRPRLLTVQALTSQPDVRLEEERVALREVTVKGKGLYKRTHILGHDKQSSVSTNTLGPNNLGEQVGAVISLARRPTRVLNANFNIARNSTGTVTCRINFYRLDAKGRPTEEKLLGRDLLVTTPVTKGTVSVDLTADQLVLDEDFFLALEMIAWTGAQPSAEMTFAATVGYFSNDIYYRPTSQAPWERTSIGALLGGMQPKLSFFVTVQD